MIRDLATASWSRPTALSGHCQSKFVYFAKTSEPNFAAIDFPAFFPGRSERFDGRSKYLEFCSDNALGHLVLVNPDLRG